jgi:hypothetical protein
MTDFDLWGPWTGNALHFEQPPITRRRRNVRRALLALAIAAIALGAWLGLNHA